MVEFQIAHFQHFTRNASKNLIYACHILIKCLEKCTPKMIPEIECHTKLLSNKKSIPGAHTLAKIHQRIWFSVYNFEFFLLCLDKCMVNFLPLYAGNVMNILMLINNPGSVYYYVCIFILWWQIMGVCYRICFCQLPKLNSICQKGPCHRN